MSEKKVELHEFKEGKGGIADTLEFDPYTVMIQQLVRACYDNSFNHGFHDQGFNFGEKIALIHSELSEALESYRKDPKRPDDHLPQYDNVTVELADTCIRIFDLAGKLGCPLGKAILDKMEYNSKRPYKHGKNF